MELIVNGEKFEQTAIDQEMRRIRAADPSMSDKKAKDLVVDQLTRRALLTQEAEKRFPDIPQAAIDEEFTRLTAQHGGAKAFYQRYNLSAKDEPGIKQDLARQIRVEQLFDSLTNSVEKPDDQELQDQYDAHPEAYVSETTIKASHIVKTPDREDPEATYTEMLEIRKKLLAGAEFAKTADEYSGCNDRGGELGTFGRGKMVEEFETVVFSMEPGEISPVFRTQFGLHVAKVFERKEAAQMSFSEAKSRIYSELYGRRQEEALSAWVKIKKKKAQIVVNE